MRNREKEAEVAKAYGIEDPVSMPCAYEDFYLAHKHECELPKQLPEAVRKRFGKNYIKIRVSDTTYVSRKQFTNFLSNSKILKTYAASQAKNGNSNINTDEDSQLLKEVHAMLKKILRALAELGLKVEVEDVGAEP